MRVTLLTLLLASLAPVQAGQITTLYQAPVAADGITETTVQLLIPGVIPTDRIKVSSEDARIVSQSVAGNVLTVVLVANPTLSPDAAALVIKVRGNTKLDESVEIPVLPNPRGAFEFSFDPPEILQGQDEATVRIRPNGTAHLPDSARSLALRASVGTITEAAPAGDGSWVARYTPPEEMDAPVAVLLTAADLTAPEQVYGSATLPVMVRSGQTFDTEAGSNNVLVVEGREYGPAEASPMGKVAFDVDLHPAQSGGTLKVAADGEPRQFEVQIEHGAQPQIAFAPWPEGLSVPANRELTLMLSLSAANGQSWSGALLEGLSVQGTNNPKIEDAGGGWYAVSLTAPPSGEWSVTASVGDASAQISGTSVLDLPRLSLSTDPDTLEDDPRELTLTVRAKNSQGTAMPGQDLQVAVEGEGVRSREDLVDNSDGTYTQSMRLLSDAEGLEISVYNTAVPSGLPPAELLIWPVEPGFTAGTDTSLVRVVAVDALGLPVPNQSITLGVPMGDGTLPPSADTGEHGVGLATYQIGPATGEVLLRAELNGLEGTYSTWQVPAGSPLPGWSPLGSLAQRESIETWRNATPVLRIGETAPAAVAVAVTTPVTAPAGTAPTTTTPAGTTPAGTPVVATDPNAGTGTPNAATTGTGTPTAVTDPGTATTTGGGLLDGGDGLADLARARVHLISTGIAYEMVSESTGAGQLPPEADFDGTRGFGTSVRGEFWPNRSILGADARVRFWRYTVSAADDDLSDSISDIVLAARGRYALLDNMLYVGGGVGYHRSESLIFLYEDDKRVEAVLEDVGISGVRASANVGFAYGPVYAEAEFAETFGLAPIDMYFGGLVDVEVFQGLTASVGFDQNIRNVSVDVSDAVTDEDYETDLSDIRNAVSFGVGYAF